MRMQVLVQLYTALILHARGDANHHEPAICDDRRQHLRSWALPSSCAAAGEGRGRVVESGDKPGC